MTAYNEEFAALLDETPMTAAVVLDIVGHAVKLQVQGRRQPVHFCLAHGRDHQRPLDAARSGSNPRARLHDRPLARFGAADDRRSL